MTKVTIEELAQQLQEQKEVNEKLAVKLDQAQGTNLELIDRLDTPTAFLNPEKFQSKGKVTINMPELNENGEPIKVRYIGKDDKTYTGLKANKSMELWLSYSMQNTKKGVRLILNIDGWQKAQQSAKKDTESPAPTPPAPSAGQSDSEQIGWK